MLSQSSLKLDMIFTDEDGEVSRVAFVAVLTKIGYDFYFQNFQHLKGIVAVLTKIGYDFYKNLLAIEI
jgi:hypothetical protein